MGAALKPIPGALIKRVEVLTGGASAAYGADAVAGVVNFIMMDDFEGVMFDFQAGGYRHDNSGNEASASTEAVVSTRMPGPVVEETTHLMM